MVDDLDPAAVERATAAQVLAAHAIRGVRDGLWHCECGAMWAVNVFDPPADVVAFTQHQADMLAAAGLLVTPEHDAQVAARALREAAEAEYQRGGATLAVERLLARADRIERQEGDPHAAGCGACWACVPDYPGMRVCATCGNKRCPHASDHRHACTGSNDVGQTGSAYERQEGE